MITIIIGHIVGALLPLFFFKNIDIVGSADSGKMLTYLLLFGLIVFLEYQLFRSVKFGVIYFRGQVDEFNESKFKSCQFSYSILCGFVAVMLLQNIL